MIKNQLKKLEKEYKNIANRLSEPKVISDTQKLKKLAKRQAELEEIIQKIKKHKEIEEKLKQAESILKEEEEELRELAQEEIKKLITEKNSLEKEIKVALLPRDPNDPKNAILEIRAGVGGDEAELFAADLYRMYCRYAEKKGLRVEVLQSSRTPLGGFKEIIFSVSGEGAYGIFKYESGVHRVQRIPITEKGGRIHTSTATCAVLPEAEEVDIKINPHDLKIDVFRSSGPGGQSVNTTDSAVRITHMPSGLTVLCQDERSQIKNRQRALKILKSKLLLQKQEEQIKKRGEARRIQIGTGERSEKIRTYNFPQNRITDHRIKFSVKNLEDVLDGELDVLINKLQEEDQKKKLELSNQKRD